MRFLVSLFRVIFGLTFILSGFLKVVDPVGTGLIMEEYFKMMHLSFLTSLAIPSGLILSLLEFLIGICILLGLRMKVSMRAGLLLMLFFTGLTLVLAVFNPIHDCGCFGEAIHLTNWQTFGKDVILTVLISVIFIKKKYFSSNIVASPKIEWISIGVYALLILGVGIDALKTQPMMDFGNFQIGTDVNGKLELVQENVKYNTVFTYEKYGKTQVFNLENLPDDSWTFVDSKSVVVSGEERDAFDFTVSDLDGHYVTEKLLRTDRSIVFFIITDLQKMYNSKKWNKIKVIESQIINDGAEVIYLSSAQNQDAKDFCRAHHIPEDIFLYTDYKTLISMNRSNGGLVYMNDGVIVDKAYLGEFNKTLISKMLTSDPDYLIARKAIGQRLSYEIAIALLLLSLVLIRIVSYYYRKIDRKIRRKKALVLANKNIALVKISEEITIHDES
ncbi:MAG: BT_3928 family protein [Bacteroidales bacterium]